MSQTAGSTYEELVMTNYDPRKSERGSHQFTLFSLENENDEEEIALRIKSIYRLLFDPFQFQEVVIL